MRTALLALTVTAAAAFAVLASSESALAVERNFAGSAQLDYHFVPTLRDANARANGEAFDAFTLETSLKVAVDFSDHLSADVKICFGCHGFEADMAYFDYRIADELNFRIGRFSPSFGAFNLRHDVANHRLSDKPLPYDMGRMLRMRSWNLGVLPSPFTDNGIEVDGMHWFGDTVQLDYAVYAVSGFKGDSNALDLDFTQSRGTYYVDNNSRPAGGARTSLTWKWGASSDATLGVSAMGGTFDPANEHWYWIGGADLAFRFDRTNVRFEYLVRRQDFDDSDRTRLKYIVPEEHGTFFVKHGAYAEIEQPLTHDVDLVARVDTLNRVGNVAQGSDLRRRNYVWRETLGTSIAIEKGLRLKLSGELWQFSADDSGGHRVDFGAHTAMVGAF